MCKEKPGEKISPNPTRDVWVIDTCCSLMGLFTNFREMMNHGEPEGLPERGQRHSRIDPRYQVFRWLFRYSLSGITNDGQMIFSFRFIYNPGWFRYQICNPSIKNHRLFTLQLIQKEGDGHVNLYIIFFGNWCPISTSTIVRNVLYDVIYKHCIPQLGAKMGP